MRTIALFADRWILPGLHVTLASLLDHAASSPPFRIVLFAERLKSAQEALLARTVAPRLGPHRFEVRPFVTPLAGRVGSLRGNYTTYGRLFLPDLIPDAASCIYLDCDLIVTRSLEALFDLGASDLPLHAEGTGVRRDSIDRPTFEALHMDPAGVYFNAGVLVFNLDRWRHERLTDRCLAFATRPPVRLMSQDQTVLNCLFADRTGTFDASFNTFLWPTSAPIPIDARHGRVFHFVGAPKPWNYLGRRANRNGDWWWSCARRTQWWQDWPSRCSSRLALTRELRLARATLRALR